MESNLPSTRHPDPQSDALNLNMNDLTQCNAMHIKEFYKVDGWVVCGGGIVSDDGPDFTDSPETKIGLSHFCLALGWIRLGLDLAWTWTRACHSLGCCSKVHL